MRSKKLVAASVLSLACAALVGAALRLVFLNASQAVLDGAAAANPLPQGIMALATFVAFVALVRRPWAGGRRFIVSTLLAILAGYVMVSAIATLSGACQLPGGVPTRGSGGYALDSRTSVMPISAAEFRRLEACESGDVATLWVVSAVLLLWRVTLLDGARAKT